MASRQLRTDFDAALWVGPLEALPPRAGPGQQMFEAVQRRIRRSGYLHDPVVSQEWDRLGALERAVCR
jgi:hypothetical protein